MHLMIISTVCAWLLHNLWVAGIALAFGGIAYVLARNDFLKWPLKRQVLVQGVAVAVVVILTALIVGDNGDISSASRAATTALVWGMLAPFLLHGLWWLIYAAWCKVWEWSGKK